MLEWIEEGFSGCLYRYSGEVRGREYKLSQNNKPKIKPPFRGSRDCGRPSSIDGDAEVAKFIGLILRH